MAGEAGEFRIVDCWVNPLTSEHAEKVRTEYIERVARDTFRREEEVFRGTPMEVMVSMMQAEGIERGILTIDPGDPEPFVEMAAGHGDRFLLSTVIDPTQGMEAVRTVVSQLRIPYRWEGGGSQQVLPTEDLRYREGM